ncbi:MAG: hypothetical protein AAGF30_03905 [Pseudomonadota bacterium]
MLGTALNWDDEPAFMTTYPSELARAVLPIRDVNWMCCEPETNI